MPSTSFSAVSGRPQTINCTWNCDLCGFLFISISYSLIPQHWLPPWYVCCVPAHLHTCPPSSQQKPYENTAFSEFYSSRVITLLPSHYLASVASLCFHQHLCPHAYIFFVNLLNSFNQVIVQHLSQWAQLPEMASSIPTELLSSSLASLSLHPCAVSSPTFYFPFLWSQPLIH